MPVSEVVKEIKGDDGQVYTYSIHHHPAEEGLELLPKVLTIVSESLGKVLGASGVDMDAEDFSILDQDLDMESIGKAISVLSQEFVRAGGPSFCKEVLKYAVRQDGSGSRVKVPQGFSAIYASNYGELGRAMIAALDVNFGPSLRGLLGDVGMNRMIDSLQPPVD